MVIMKTSKNLTNISYCTEDYLKVTLDNLVDIRYISWYMFINHLGDEDIKKDHRHIYIIPNGRIDTDKLDTELTQLVEDNEKPLKCMVWRTESLKNFGDVYLYYLHDSQYLACKGLTRNLHYTEDDIITSDRDQLHEFTRTIDYRKIYGAAYINNAVENNIPFRNLVAQGYIPVNQISYAKAYYNEVAAYYQEQIEEAEKQAKASATHG